MNSGIQDAGTWSYFRRIESVMPAARAIVAIFKFDSSLFPRAAP